VVGYYDGGRGFLLSVGVFTTIDAPDALATWAYGINDIGRIVGSYRPNNSNLFIGFQYDISSQTFTAFQYSQNTLTTALAINNAGTIVGVIQKPESNSAVGFVLDGATYTKTAAPKATHTNLTSINNSGESMVVATNNSGDLRSFLLKQGKLVRLDTPHNVEPFWINDLDVITGAYTRPAGQAHGFVYQNGVHQSLTFPASTSTVAIAMNNSGEVVGFFYDVSGNLHGFRWTPPADTSTNSTHKRSNQTDGAQ
jgi:hypothetical protein